jgi:hypothetical protein
VYPRKRLSTKYRRYIKSKKWREFKARIISARGRVCQECGKTTYEMHLHHLTYIRLGNELPSDVKLLCINCHEKIEMEKWKASHGK